jgi:hypothetical protein
MLVSTFEVLVKPQLPDVAKIAGLSRTVIQGYFLTIANVNFFPVTVSIVFTIKFPRDPSDPNARPQSFDDFLDAIDVSGKNLLSIFDPEAKLVPELVPQNNKARLTFTLPENDTGLLILQPDILSPTLNLLSQKNFEARGYVEIFLSSLSGSNDATLMVTPEHRGTFFKDLDGETTADIGLDQIAYTLPVTNGGIFNLSNV